MFYKSKPIGAKRDPATYGINTFILFPLLLISVKTKKLRVISYNS